MQRHWTQQHWQSLPELRISALKWNNLTLVEVISLSPLGKARGKHCSKRTAVWKSVVRSRKSSCTCWPSSSMNLGQVTTLSLLPSLMSHLQCGAWCWMPVDEGNMLSFSFAQKMSKFFSFRGQFVLLFAYQLNNTKVCSTYPKADQIKLRLKELIRRYLDVLISNMFYITNNNDNTNVTLFIIYTVLSRFHIQQLWVILKNITLWCMKYSYAQFIDEKLEVEKE